MNKIIVFLLLGVSWITFLAAQPILEIAEFGKKDKLTIKLTGKEQQVSGVNWNCSIRKVTGKVPCWSLAFTSLEKKNPKRLQLNFLVPVNFTAQRLFDGDIEIDIKKLPFVRSNYLDAFPIITVENGKLGQALGFAPQTILSAFSRKFDGKTLSLATRIVVDNRRTQVIDIVDYNFNPEFGWRNAIEDYHNAFIKWFVPQKGVDSRIYGVSGYHLGGHLQRVFQLHSQRHHKISWEWTYAPWYESGNWFAAGDGWTGKKNIYWDYYGHKKTKLLTKEEYHEAIKKEMHYGNKVSAMFYYILVKDIHNNVAKNYPDSVQGSSGLHSRPSNAGKTKSVFAPGSPIFDYLKKQIRQIVENYEVSGFAFDMANSSFHFTTKSQLNYAVGRSWYDDGTIFTSDTVAPIPFAQYIHSLCRNGKKMGTVFNVADQMISPFTFFHTDGAILEGPPTTNARLVLPLRLIMGRKPLSFWHLRTLPFEKWRLAHQPDKIKEYEKAFKLLYLLKCYELGFAPMNWVSGLEEIKPHLSALRAISKAGYHPVSAIKGANQLWGGRFGDDTRTILTISNPKREKLSRTIRVVNRYLGDGKYAFISVNGKLAQKFENGNTVFEITLKPKEILVLRTVKIDGNISEITTETTQQNIVLNGNGRFAFSLPAKDFDGRLISGATKDVFSGNTENRISLSILPASRIFGDVTAMVGLMRQENSLAVEAGNGADTQIAAEMVAMYRPHVAASMKYVGKVNNGGPGFMDSSLARLDLVITSPTQGKAGKKICLGTPKDFPDFTPPENWNRAFLSMPNTNTLWIGGSKPEEVRKAALVYFDLLDKYQTTKTKVNFVLPSDWGGRAIFVPGKGQKYLQMVGDPQRKNNNFYYAFYNMSSINGIKSISFKVSCKLEKLISGKYKLGIYEFLDEKCHKSIRFQAIEIPENDNWQIISKRINLHPKTKRVRFYALGQNANKNATLLLRSLEFEYFPSVAK